MAEQTAHAGAIPTTGAQWRKPVPTWRRIIAGFVRNRGAMVGLVILVVIAGSAAFADQVAPHSPTKNNLRLKLTPPVWAEGGHPDHLLGTDAFGRDMLSRLIHGAQASMSVALVAGLMAMTLGVFIGLISGYFGGKVDAALMRIGDAQIAFPFLVIAIAIIAILGPSLVNLVVLLGYWGWVSYGKVTRAQVLSAKEKEYVEAARVIGTSTPRIIFRHLLPNVVSPVVVMLTLSLAVLIIVESSLSFLGLGIQPPTPSWGSMLSDGRNVIDRAWWVSTFPGLAIMITVLSINLLGDGIRDALDPRMRF